jgi:hypothetical protein
VFNAAAIAALGPKLAATLSTHSFSIGVTTLSVYARQTVTSLPAGHAALSCRPPCGPHAPPPPSPGAQPAADCCRQPPATPRSRRAATPPRHHSGKVTSACTLAGALGAGPAPPTVWRWARRLRSAASGCSPALGRAPPAPRRR